jgi:DNA-binding HxlR family transcriptional regulator
MRTRCARTNSGFALGNEVRRLVESRIGRTLKGVEETLQCLLEKQISLEDLRENIQSLEESFGMLSQKWNLELLYTLFLKSTISFSQMKRTLGVNSRTLSDKLKTLKQRGYIERSVKTEPPLRVEYKLTARGRNTVLLALPLLYHSGSAASPRSE